MDTSGVLLAAKDAATASLVNSQFQDKRVSKAYLAICLGVPQQQSFTVEGPIAQHPTVHVARRVHPDGQPAVTHVQVGTVFVTCPAVMRHL
jgi:23S rRNA-/tRNA-specific pseudouridylate synthase